MLSGAAAAGCRPRHSMQGKPAGRSAPCPGCSGAGRPGPKERLACGLSLAESAATAGGVRHPSRPKLRQMPRQSTRSLAQRRPWLLQCPLLVSNFLSPRRARQRCLEQSQRRRNRGLLMWLHGCGPQPRRFQGPWQQLPALMSEGG